MTSWGRRVLIVGGGRNGGGRGGGMGGVIDFGEEEDGCTNTW